MADMYELLHQKISEIITVTEEEFEFCKTLFQPKKLRKKQFSILILIGFGTRLAAIPLIITMAVAAFLIHSADPFGKQEMAILYLVVYVVLLIAGSGRYSLDSLLAHKTVLELSTYGKTK